DVQTLTRVLSGNGGLPTPVVNPPSRAMSRRVVASRPWRTITVRAATQTSRRRRSVRSAVEGAEVVITVVTPLPSRGQCRQCARQDADRGGDIVLAGELVRA